TSARVEIVPVGRPGAVRLELLVEGQRQSDAEITVISPDASRVKIISDHAGLTEPLGQTGRYAAWARHWEACNGVHRGKAYGERRDYATLVFDVSTSPEIAKSEALPVATRFAALPQAASSFGAVVSNGFLYVYGGHIAPTHSYSTEAVSGRFSRLNLSGDPAWEELPGGAALQGMNLAAYKGQVYRIGGMSPRNKPGTAQAIFSVAECARFDQRTMKWHAIASLPEPRSSHDVAVIGDKLIAVGGWTLNGSKPTKWADTLAVMDLTASKPEWK